MTQDTLNTVASVGTFRDCGDRHRRRRATAPFARPESTYRLANRPGASSGSAIQRMGGRGKGTAQITYA